jgi:hypothetical protein
MIAQLMNLLAGLWVTASPGALDYGRPLATSDHIVGPLVATFACIAMWEATRPLRWVNLPMGVWTGIAPFMLGAPPSGLLNGLACGLLVAFCATRGGTIKQRFDGGWSVLWRPH